MKKSKHSIAFNHEMVRAILEGRKTQTRRIMKPQPRQDQIMPNAWSDVMRYNPNAIYGDGLSWVAIDENGNDYEFRCPYGQPGDHLLVSKTSGEACDFCDHPEMRQAASRILLEIVSVRVEHLQEISEQDAKAEGVKPNWIGPLDEGGERHRNRRMAWRRIHALHAQPRRRPSLFRKRKFRVAVEINLRTR